MSVVNIEFWNNAGFTKLNMMEKNITWFSDFGKLYTGIGTVKLDRDVYVMMDESTVIVTD